MSEKKQQTYIFSQFEGLIIPESVFIDEVNSNGLFPVLINEIGPLIRLLQSGAQVFTNKQCIRTESIRGVLFRLH